MQQQWERGARVVVHESDRLWGEHPGDRFQEVHIPTDEFIIQVGVR